MYYACLCAIAKDEDLDIREWAEYHLLIGFEHIYIYDNNSHNSLAELLRDLAEINRVTIIPFPLQSNQQLTAYMDSLRTYGAQTVWMGYLDIDEFVVPKAHGDIRDLLDDYRDYGGLGIHWKIFGSNGHKRRPENGVMRNYTQVLNDDAHIKSIIQPLQAVAPRSPHHFAYRDNACCVNEDKIPILAHHSYHVSRLAQINHYYYKSFEDFLHKMERGLATPARGGRNTRNEDELEAFSRQAREKGYPDKSILHLLDRHYNESTAATKRTAHLSYDPAGSLRFFAERIALHLRQGAMPEAEQTLKQCLRSHDIADAWIIAAKLYILTNKQKKALNFLYRILQDAHSPHRDEAFVCLADYYKHIGHQDTAQNILRGLEKGQHDHS